MSFDEQQDRDEQERERKKNREKNRLIDSREPRADDCCGNCSQNKKLRCRNADLTGGIIRDESRWCSSYRPNRTVQRLEKSERMEAVNA